MQKLVREMGQAHSTFKGGVDAQIDSPILEGANQEKFKAPQEDLGGFIQQVAASVRSVENKPRGLEGNKPNMQQRLLNTMPFKKPNIGPSSRRPPNKANVPLNGSPCKPHL